MKNDSNILILKLLHIIKTNKLEKVNKTSLVKYLYFLDYFYARKYKKQFSTIDWKMNSYGPHFSQVDNDLYNLTKNKKVNYYPNNMEQIYFLSEACNDNNFEIPEIKEVLFDWESLIKEYQHKQNLKALLNKTYSTEPIENKVIGDSIKFDNIYFVNFKEDIKSINIMITNQEKIKRLKELGAKIQNKPLETSNYQFLNPALSESDFNSEVLSDNNFPNLKGLEISL